MMAAILVAPVDAPPPIKFCVLGPERPLALCEGTADCGLLDRIYQLIEMALQLVVLWCDWLLSGLSFKFKLIMINFKYKILWQVMRWG